MIDAKVSRKRARKPVVTANASRCPKCQSTERERYFKTVEVAIGGRELDGNEYTHVVRRWTRCKACGQARIDRSCEYRPEWKSGPQD